MSAYIKFATPMLDQECLVMALMDMGFKQAHIEVHGAPVSLVGYEGTSRSQTAEVVIRREFVGSSSNDIGFCRTPTGYVAIISDYDLQRYGPDWLKGLHSRYQEHEQRKVARLAEEARLAAEEEERIRAESELRRIEEEQRRVVETQRQKISEKAKKLGYTVQEKREGDGVRLVLVKRTY